MAMCPWSDYAPATIAFCERRLCAWIVEPSNAWSNVAYVLVGLLSLVLVVFFVAALVLPPMFMHTLILRGVRTGRPGMLAAGLVLAAVYFAVLVGAGRRVMGRTKAAAPRLDD